MNNSINYLRIDFTQKFQHYLYIQATKYYINESLIVKRKIFYNIIIISLCILLSGIFLFNMIIHRNQTSENPVFFICVIILLLINFFLIRKGISFQIIPSYSIIVFTSIFTYFINVDFHSEVIIVAMFSFITMIWLFVSYKWWHLIMNIINAGTISVIRLFSLNNAFEFGELTINEYLLSINAYIYLLFTVLLSFILYYIMNRELKLSNDKAEQFRMRSKMYEELVNIVKEESIDTTKIKQEFEGYFDPMTGCLTRLAYENLFVANTKKRLTERSIEITYIDLNELKQVNDNYGHTKGDAYLVAAVKAIKENISSYEGLFRIGGDEFVLITINQPIELLKNKLEAANKRLSQLVNIKGFSGQFSFGIATSSEVKDKDIRKIEQIADKRMYSMKNKKILITVAESASQQ